MKTSEKSYFFIKVNGASVLTFSVLSVQEQRLKGDQII